MTSAPPSPTSSTPTRTRVLSLPEVGEAITGGRWRGHYRHTKLVAKHLMRVAYGLSSRLIVQMPPRHGKTILAARLFPFYYLAQFPHRDVIYVGSTGPFAAEQGEYLQGLFERYGPSFGVRVSHKSRAKDNFDLVDLNNRPTGGSVRCFGVGSSVHGRNAHLLLLDDLYGTVEDALSPAYRESVWRTYTSALYTRLAPDSAIVAIGTPFHADDWFGRAQAAEEAGGDAWERVKLPAFAGPQDALGRAEGDPLWPEGGWTTERLERTRAAMEAGGNSRDWAAQYELDPVTGDGVSVWPAEYFADHVWTHELPIDEKNPQVCRVLALDPSKSKTGHTGDYAAFCDATLLHDRHVYCNMHLARAPLEATYARAVALVRQARAEGRPYQRFIIEINQFQEAIALAVREQLQRAGLDVFIDMHNTPSTLSKHARIQVSLGPLLQQNRLHFLGKTVDNSLTVNQMRQLPNAEHDDGPDAIEMATQAINLIIHGAKRPTAPVVIRPR